MYRSTSTSTPSRPKSSTTSSIPQSTSLPALPPINSPPPSTPAGKGQIRPSTSTEHLRSPQTPASSSKNKNFHPYLIQTTSSSLLSRTNSSPSQPMYEGGPRHRVSRSMSALNKPEGIIYEAGSMGVAVESGSDAGSDHGMDTPGRSPAASGHHARVGMKRSGTLPSFPSMENLKVQEKQKQAELPNDPKAWNASELAQYLSQSLRKGSSGSTEQSLPGPLVDDIQSWILRHQVTGRAFLKGPETWTTSSRPPPFLPLLTSISRRLRRSSLQSRISNSRSTPIPEDEFGPSSILVEEQESDQDYAHHNPRQMGVKGMAQAYDAIHSSASEASGDESTGGTTGPLRAQNTGDHRREVWKRWEAEMRPRALRRQDTGSSIGSVDEVALAAARGDQAYAAVSESESEEDAGRGGTIKPRPLPSKAQVTALPLEASASVSASSSATSPPPPYASGTDTSPDKLPVSTTSSRDISTPLRPAPRSASHSVTPTPDPLRLSATAANAGQSPLPTPTRARQSLGRSTSRRLPKGLAKDLGAGTETDDEYDLDADAMAGAGARSYSSARRVTIRPTPRVSSRSIFADIPNPSQDIKSPRELELEKELDQVKDRLKELEAKFSAVASVPGPAAVAPDDTKSQISTTPGYGYVLSKLGLGAGTRIQEDGLPNTVKELPAYLFLVGFGVGAVVVRVLFSRR